jgi:hypothetical protein
VGEVYGTGDLVYRPPSRPSEFAWLDRSTDRDRRHLARATVMAFIRRPFCGFVAALTAGGHDEGDGTSGMVRVYPKGSIPSAQHMDYLGK